MKKEVTLAKVLSLPVALSKRIIEKNLPIKESLQMVEEEGFLKEYKGPFTSGVKALCSFNDVITVNCFEEAKQPDGTYLITYVCKYVEKYKMSLYVRVLTSGIKRKLKYHSYENGTEIKLKGDLDVFVDGPMSFLDEADGSMKVANIAVVITIIDIL